MVSFEERCKTDPQGVIDDFVRQTTRQAKAIHDLTEVVETLKKEQEKLLKGATKENSNVKPKRSVKVAGSNPASSTDCQLQGFPELQQDPLAKEPALDYENKNSRRWWIIGDWWRSKYIGLYRFYDGSPVGMAYIRLSFVVFGSVYRVRNKTKKISPKRKGDNRTSKHEEPTECFVCGLPLPPNVLDADGNIVGESQYTILLIDAGTFDGAICRACQNQHGEAVWKWPYVYEDGVEYIYDYRKKNDGIREENE